MNYAGDVKPEDAFEILKNEGNSYLIDVRTLPEWSFSGVPSLSSVGKKVSLISWMFYPRMELNNDFAASIEKLVPNQNAKLFFLCKTGGRSLDAAIEMTKKGYNNCYNIQNGFEGSADENNQRGKMNGWKASGLPWEHP